MTTRRLASDLIETTLVGRVKVADVRKFLQDFTMLGGSRYWLFNATDTTSYEAAAVRIASDGILKTNVQLIIVAVTSSLVRMGASVVAMATRREMIFVKSRTEGMSEIERRRIRD